MKRPEVYARHILDATERIGRHLEGVNFSEFLKDELRQDAVIRQIEIIGEATKRLSSEFKASVSEIPWRKVAGMRDKLIHDYMGTDLKAVWRVTKKDLPPLKAALKRRLGKLI